VSQPITVPSKDPPAMGPDGRPCARRFVVPAAGISGLPERLERGEILVFPKGALPLPSEDDLVFLRRELGSLLTLKNISFHPNDGTLSGIRRDPPRKERTRRILREYNRGVEELLGGALPEYGGRWRIEKVNFRPIQEEGRTLRPRSSNERIHTDALASGATHGARILRFFTNIHPTEPRVWKSGGLFPGLATEFAAKARYDRPVALRSGPMGRAWSGFLRLASRAIPPAILADTSPYDRAMLRLHNALKDDERFQADLARQVTMAFAPFESWCVMTDMVSHAVIRGQHALVSTFYLALDACVRPDLAPWSVLKAFP